MLDKNRREFLQLTAAIAGAVPLTGCGGGGDGATEASRSPEPVSLAPPAPPPPPVTPPPPPAPPPAPAPAPVGVAAFVSNGSMRFALTSANAGSNLPFSLGFAFRPRDLPRGSSLLGSVLGVPLSIQATIKNFWADGSAKFAVLAGRASLQAGAPLVVQLSAGAASTAGTALTTADLRATGITSTIDGAALGAASWAGSDWDRPFSEWVSGPGMSSWIYRKPIGSDAHLVAWLEVRLFAGGAVEVLPWIENGYLNVAGPTVKAAVFSFSLGGVSKFSASVTLPHHTRTPLIGGAALSYWLGVDPGVVPHHDKSYLQATELVPSYFAAASDASVNGQAAASTFAPLQQGDYKFGPDQLDLMPNSGYGEPIGLLPGWDSKLLTCSAAVHATAYAAVIRNGYSAGRYPIHYRDENTNKPPAFSTHATRCLADYRNDGSGFKSQGGSPTGTYTPAITSTSGTKIWDTAHSPAIGFLPYLLTGLFYFMEEVQFAATTNFLGNDAAPILRDGAKGIHQPAYAAWQVRSCAWGWRALAHALCVTPDADTALRSEFQSSMQANIDFYHARYVAQPNNPLGFIFDWDAGPNGVGLAAPWQADFLTAAVGYSLAMRMPLSAGYENKLSAFFSYVAKSIVGRLGVNNATDWWYINAFPYQVAVTPRFVPDWKGGTGPWFSSWRAAYDASYSPGPAWLGATDGVLAFEYPRPIDAVRGFFGNAVPALAYAVRHGATGALAAYNRVTNASNYPDWATAFNDFPVWSVSPARLSPSWLQGRALNEWFEIQGTAGAGGAPLNDYSGFAVTEDAKIAAGAAGGHGGSRDNRVVVLDLLTDAPSWRVLNTASTNAPDDVAYNPDGKPASRHTYASTLYVRRFDRVMLFGVRFTAPGASTFNKVDGFSASTGVWSGVVQGSPGTTDSGYTDIAPGYYGAVVDGFGDVWSVLGLRKYTASTNRWSAPITRAAADSVRYPWAWDSRRSMLFGLCWGDGEGFNTGVRAIKQDGTTQTQITFNASGALTQFAADAPNYAGMGYDPENDRFLFFSNSAPTRVYVITPNAGSIWDMSILPLGGGSVSIAANGPPLLNKFQYVPQLRGFVCMPNADRNLLFLRTA